MANHKGSEGTVKVGANAVAEIKSYSLTETADTIEDTVMGDSARTYQSSLTSFRDRKSTRLNSSHSQQSRMPSSA